MMRARSRGPTLCRATEVPPAAPPQPPANTNTPRLTPAALGHNARAARGDARALDSANTHRHDRARARVLPAQSGSRGRQRSGPTGQRSVGRGDEVPLRVTTDRVDARCGCIAGGSAGNAAIGATSCVGRACRNAGSAARDARRRGRARRRGPRRRAAPTDDPSVRGRRPRSPAASRGGHVRISRSNVASGHGRSMIEHRRSTRRLSTFMGRRSAPTSTTG
jgi:hypothetical protein